MGADGVAEILRGIRDLYVTRGRKILHFEIGKGGGDREEILEMVLGRSGKLRSPALRMGTTLLVGYTPELLETHLL